MYFLKTRFPFGNDNYCWDKKLIFFPDKVFGPNWVLLSMDEVADLMEELKLKATEGQLFSAAVKWCRCFGEDDDDMNLQVQVELGHRG